jgi:hypothetical protein
MFASLKAAETKNHVTLPVTSYSKHDVWPRATVAVAVSPTQVRQAYLRAGENLLEMAGRSCPGGNARHRLRVTLVILVYSAICGNTLVLPVNSSVNMSQGYKKQGCFVTRQVYSLSSAGS